MTIKKRIERIVRFWEKSFGASSDQARECKKILSNENQMDILDLLEFFEPYVDNSIVINGVLMLKERVDK